jgi:tetratricopeptide (TPR) repeat protein
MHFGGTFAAHPQGHVFAPERFHGPLEHFSTAGPPSHMTPSYTYPRTVSGGITGGRALLPQFRERNGNEGRARFEHEFGEHGEPFHHGEHGEEHEHGEHHEHGVFGYPGLWLYGGFPYYPYWYSYPYAYYGYGYPSTVYNYYEYPQYAEAYPYATYGYGTSTGYVSPPTAEQPSAEASTFLSEARDAFHDGHYREAVRLAAHAAVDAPKDPAVHQLMSLAMFALGDYHGAAIEAHAALALGPAPTWDETYPYYASPDDYTTQLRALEAFVHEHFDNADGHFLLGYEYLMLGDRQQAGQQFAQAAEQMPADELAQHMAESLGVKPAGATPQKPAAPKAQKPATTAPQGPPTSARGGSDLRGRELLRTRSASQASACSCLRARRKGD